MSCCRPGSLLAVTAAAVLGLAGCATAPSGPVAIATPAVRPAPPPVSMVAEAVGQRLDAMLAANLSPIRHP